MDHQGAVKVRIPAFPLPTHPDAGKEMLFVFIRMCDFLPPFLFGSSCLDQDKDLEGLWHRLRLPAESLLLCPAATQPYGWRKTSQRERIFQKRHRASAVQLSHGASISLFALAIIAAKRSRVLSKEWKKTRCNCLAGRAALTESTRKDKTLFLMKIAVNLCFLWKHTLISLCWFERSLSC